MLTKFGFIRIDPAKAKYGSMTYIKHLEANDADVLKGIFLGLAVSVPLVFLLIVMHLR